MVMIFGLWVCGFLNEMLWGNGETAEVVGRQPDGSPTRMLGWGGGMIYVDIVGGQLVLLIKPYLYTVGVGVIVKFGGD